MDKPADSRPDSDVMLDLIGLTLEYIWKTRRSNLNFQFELR